MEEVRVGPLNEVVECTCDQLAHPCSVHDTDHPEVVRGRDSTNPTHPAVTTTDEFGHVRVDWPELRLPSYLVAERVIAQWADTLNRIADLREHLAQGKAYRNEVLAIIDQEG